MQKPNLQGEKAVYLQTFLERVFGTAMHGTSASELAQHMAQWPWEQPEKGLVFFAQALAGTGRDAHARSHLHGKMIDRAAVSCWWIG